MSNPKIEFSVKVVDGAEARFDSVLIVPLAQSEEKKREAVEAWLQMIEAGLKLTRAVKTEGPSQ